MAETPSPLQPTKSIISCENREGMQVTAWFWVYSYHANKPCCLTTQSLAVLFGSWNSP
jgi:hypothetical protein